MLAFLRALREDKPQSTLLILVYLSLLLDNMLLTVVGKQEARLFSTLMVAEIFIDLSIIRFSKKTIFRTQT